MTTLVLRHHDLTAFALNSHLSVDLTGLVMGVDGWHVGGVVRQYDANGPIVGTVESRNDARFGTQFRVTVPSNFGQVLRPNDRLRWCRAYGLHFDLAPDAVWFDGRHSHGLVRRNGTNVVVGEVSWDGAGVPVRLDSITFLVTNYTGLYPTTR